MEPRVTIILTVYKRTEYLRPALDGAFAQTYPNFEVVVADDSGEGIAREICEAYNDRGPLRYHANPKTLGIALSLRAAIGRAQGKYLAILNDDDVWEPQFLATLIPALEENPDRVLAFSDHWIINESGEIDRAETDANTVRYGRAALTEGNIPDPPALVLLENGVPLAMASVFRKDSLDVSLLTSDVAGAYDLWISSILASLRRPFYYSPQRLTQYRIHSRMETARRSHDRSANLVYIFSQLVERGWFPEHQEYLKGRLGAALFHLGRDKLYFHRIDEARSCFRGSLLHHRDWRPAVASGLSYLPRFMRTKLKVSGSEM